MSETEEKKHPPTASKLQQLRTREGQVARSKDFPSAFSLAVTVFYVIFNFGKIQEQISSFFNIYDFIFKNTEEVSLFSVFISSMKQVFIITLPIFLIASITLTLASIMQTKGMIISFKSVAPNFKKLNPVEGIKKIFGLHGVSESIKIIFKVLFMSIAFYLIVFWGVNSLFWAPTCEEHCVIQVSIYMIIAIIIAALVIYMIVGFIDLWISKMLFMKDNKMTDTEIKKESKEQMGSTELRQARNRIRREDAQNPSVRGFGKATVIIHGGDAIIGLIYHPQKFDIPVVVGKKYGEEAKAVLLEARGKKIPEITNLEYLNKMMKYTKVGEQVPQSLIMETAQNFLDFGIIKR